MKIKSKGKGKSGGARVISYIENVVIVEIENKEKQTIVYLLSIYDKSEKDSISNEELSFLINNLEL